MTSISTGSTAEFLARLAEFTARGTLLPQEELKRAIQALPEQGLTPLEWSEVVTFAGEQHSRWLVDWLFSPAEAPRTDAASEAEAWGQMWTACAQALADDVPETVGPLRRQKELMVARRALERKEQLDRANSFARLAVSMASRLAIMLNRLGLRYLGQWVYSRALYPAGTVGREMRIE